MTGVAKVANPTPAATAPPNKEKPQEVAVGKRSTDDMKAIGGSGFELWDTQLLHRTAGTASPIPQAREDAIDAHRRNAGVAGLALHAFAPKDPVEAMIAAQATAMHLASMECFRRAMLPQQSADVTSRLRRDGTNAARGMTDMVDALARYRGKGPQVIRVEKMLVTDGGQAVVGGNMTSEVRAVSQGVAPLDIGGDVEGVSVPTPPDAQGEGDER